MSSNPDMISTNEILIFFYFLFFSIAGEGPHGGLSTQLFSSPKQPVVAALVKLHRLHQIFASL